MDQPPLHLKSQCEKNGKLLNSWLALRGIRVSKAAIAFRGYVVMIVVSGISALLWPAYVGECTYTMLFG